MEDRLEVIIYVAFILLSAFGSIYKSYSKKKAEQAAKEKRRQTLDYNTTATQQAPIPEIRKESTTKTFPSSLEEFLKQQFEMEEEVEESEVPKEIVSDKLKTKATESNEGKAVFESTSEELLSDDMNRKDFSITEMLKNREPVLLEDEENSDINNCESGRKYQLCDFDLKQAVIYSEIINRKY